MTEEQFAPFDGLQVMAYIIKMCKELGTPYNVTKLQKLCLYAIQTDLVHLIQGNEYLIQAILREAAVKSHAL